MSRSGPHTPAHRAAIAAGLRRHRWSDRQSELARRDLPHDWVPTKVAAWAGRCHWCAFWRVAPAHLNDSSRTRADCG